MAKADTNPTSHSTTEQPRTNGAALPFPKPKLTRRLRKLQAAQRQHIEDAIERIQPVEDRSK